MTCFHYSPSYINHKQQFNYYTICLFTSVWQFIWKVFMASFKAMSWHVPAGTGENHKKPVRIATVQAEICIVYLLSTRKTCTTSANHLYCVFSERHFFSLMEYCGCPHKPNVLSILCTPHLMALIILCETITTWTGVPKSLPATFSWSTPSQNPPTITAQHIIVWTEVFWPTNDEKEIKLHEPQSGSTIWSGIEERICSQWLEDCHLWTICVCCVISQAYSTYQTRQNTNSKHHARDWIFCVVMNECSEVYHGMVKSA